MKRISLVLSLIAGGHLHAMSPDQLRHSNAFANIDEVNVCPICLTANLDKPAEDNPIFTLLCGHRFCRNCITTWLRQRSMCPLCTRHFERRMHWPVMDNHIDTASLLNNIVIWTPTVSLTVFFSAVLFLIIRKLAI